MKYVILGPSQINSSTVIPGNAKKFRRDLFSLFPQVCSRTLLAFSIDFGV